MVDWRVHGNFKSWLTLEHLASNYDLHKTPWLPKDQVLTSLYFHHLIGATLHVFDRACATYAVSAKIWPITAARNNSDFPPGLSGTFLVAEWPYTEMLAKQFFHGGRFMRLNVLAELSNTGSFPFWSYMQLQHYLDYPSSRAGFSKTLTHSVWITLLPIFPLHSGRMHWGPSWGRPTGNASIYTFIKGP